MIRELPQAFRNLARRPGFTLLAAGILALGIGGATAVFSIANAVLWKPLPFPEPDRIVSVNTGIRSNVSGGDYLDLKSGVSAFAHMAYYYGGQVNVRTRNGAAFATAQFASPEFFQTLGIAAPVAGRLFTEGDTAKAAVVSNDWAERSFGSASAAIGQPVILYDAAYPIIGVIPSAQAFPARTSVWVNAPATPPMTNRTAHNYRVVARVGSGSSIEAAQAQLTAIAVRLAQQFPQTHDKKTFRATNLREFLVTGSRETLTALLGAVLILLLIACANVANLLLAQGAARTKEIAVRAALGAGAWPIVRMLLAEAFALAALATVLGLGLAKAGLQTLIALAPQNTPRLQDASISMEVLLFAVALTLLTTLLFGLFPAWQALRVDVQDALKQGSGRGIVSGRSHRLRQSLVAAEIALALTLTISSGLLFRSFLKLNEVDLGFRSGGVLVAYAAVPASGADSSSQHAAARWFTQLPGKLQTIPGVVTSSAAMGVPAGLYNSSGHFIVEGKQEWKSGRLEDLPHAQFRLTGDNYFQTLGIPLRSGRDFTVRDSFDAPFVAIVSDSLARQYFGNEDPIGKRVQCGLDSPKWMTIVGVVGDVRSASPATSPRAELYMPYQQHPGYADELQVVIRTNVEPASLTESVRTLIAAERPDVALRFQTLESMVADSISLPRFRTVLLIAFSTLAVVLALAGVYGVMVYVVEQRRGEFGVRLALGATHGDLAAITLRNALHLIAAGVGIGLPLSLLSLRVLESFLFAIPASDALTWSAAIALLALTALAAAWIPARRTSALNPSDVLRSE